MAESREASGDGRKRSVLGAIAKSCLRSLLIAAAVFVPGILLMQAEPMLGSIWLLLGSFFMMARTYRRPWRLMWITCVVPPIAALAVYVCQLAIAREEPEPAFLLGAAAVGLVVGLLRGRVHQVFVKDGAVFARRTIGYLLVWLVCYGATQVFALLRDSEAANIGRIGGAFSSMMLVAVAIVIGRKYARSKRELRAVTLAVPAAVALLVVGAAGAAAIAQDYRVETPDQAVDQLCSSLDFRWSPSNTRLFTITDQSVQGRRVMYANGEIRVRRHDSASTCLSTGNRVSGQVQQMVAGWPNDGWSTTRFERLGLGGVSFLYSYEKNNTRRRTGIAAERFGQPSGVQHAEERAMVFVGTWEIEAKAKFVDSDDDGIPWSHSQRRNIVVGMLRRAMQRLGVAATPPPVPPPVPAQPGWTPPYDPPTRRGPSSDAIAVTALISVILAAGGLIADLATSIARTVADLGGAGATAAHSEPRAKKPSAAKQKPSQETSVKRPPPPPPPPPEEPVAPPPPPEDIVEFTPGWDDTTLGWWVGTLDDTAKRANAEIDDLPRQAVMAAAALGGELLTWDNWVTGLDALIHTGKDLGGFVIGHQGTQERIAKTMQGGVETMGSIAGIAASALENDTAGALATGAKTILGVDNWEKVIDGDRDLLERIGRALWGAIDTGGTIWSAGAGTVAAGGKVAGAVSKLDDMIAIARGADKGMDLARGAGLIDKGADAVRGVGLIDKSADAARGAGLVDEGADIARGARAAEKATGAGTDAARIVDKAADAGTGAGRVAGKAADAGTDAARVVDKATDAGAGAGRVAEKATDAGTDAARVVDKAADAGTDARRVADKAADAGTDAARAADKAADAGTDAGRAVEKAADAGTDAGRGAGGAGNLDEGATAAKAGGVEDDLARGAEAADDGRVAGAYDDLPDMATDPEGYIRGLPEGAIIDQNLLRGTGYTGPQMDALKELARRHNVTIGARSTNLDSMIMIRDGVAVPKPLHIKAKTISELDTYLGAAKADKGLVGYFRPRRPDLSKVPPHLRDPVMGRFYDRVEEYDKLADSIQQMRIRGEIVTKDGKILSVVEPGVVKPFAGDIDAVYFIDKATGRPLTGPAYDAFKQAWMQSAVQGQHGAEFGIVSDLTKGLAPGSPEWHAAYDKALAAAKGLSKGHMPTPPDVLAKILDPSLKAGRAKEMVIEIGPDGIFRKGMDLTEGLPIADQRLFV